MGCDDPGCSVDESPGHELVMSAYTIDVYEVTSAFYAECVAEGACGAARTDSAPDEPVLGVTVEDARAFCEWRGMALPTEAQWERAARGDEGAVYPWGDAAPTCDHVSSLRCDGKILPVGSRPAGISPFGLLDMAGNAWEWVSDFYSFDYYLETPAADPDGPPDGYLRVVRGVTAWRDDSTLRSSDRAATAASANSALAGFRCVGEP